jgi:uncharacterized membrane protein YfcA
VTWQLVLAGLLVGTLVGMTGMGGGSLMTPILVIVFGINPTVAIGSDIAHGAIFKTVGAVQHRRMGNVRAQLAGWMLLGSAPMSLLGVWLADWLQGRYGDGIESVMGQVLGGALLFGCVGLLAKTFVRAKAAATGWPGTWTWASSAGCCSARSRACSSAVTCRCRSRSGRSASSSPPCSASPA